MDEVSCVGDIIIRMIGTNTDIDMDIDICCMRQAINRNVSLRSLFQKVKWGTWKSLWKGGGRTGPGVGGEIFRGCPWDILCYFTDPGRSKTYQFVLWRASLVSCVSSFGQAGSFWRSEGGRAEQISLVSAKNMCGWDPLPCWIPCVDSPFSSLFWFVATLILTLTVGSA